MVLCYINNNSIDIIDDINATNMINIVKTNLSVQWGDGVDCAKFSTCGDDIVALLAVASYLDFDQGQFVIAMMAMMTIVLTGSWIAMSLMML